MDKNANIGLMLIMLIFFGWYFFFLKPDQNEQQKLELKDSIPTATTPVNTPSQVASPAANDSLDLIKYGDFAPLAKGDNRTIEVKTEKMQVKLQSKGGQIQSIRLQDHQDQNKQPLPVIKENLQNQFYEEFAYQGNKGIKTDELYFTPVGNVPSTIKAGDSAALVLRAALDDQRYLEKVYRFKGDKYDIDYDFRLVGLDNDLKNNFYRLIWKSVLPTTELSAQTQRQKTTIVYALSDDVQKMGYKEEESEEPAGSVKWVSFRSQFFSSALIAEKPFAKGTFQYSTPAGDTSAKNMQAALSVNFDKSADVHNRFTIYAGPLEYYTLKSYKHEFHKQMDLGWWIVKYINAGAIWVFKKLEALNISYGIIILIFAVLIKLLIFPMTYKSFISMAKLRVLNKTPEMKAIDEKYKDDAAKLQTEKMALYNKVGVSPFSGCLPLLLQYPITISMFFFFPQAIELRHKGFLWADDLSTYDSILTLPFSIPAYGDHVSLFTILMAVSTFLFTYYNQSSQPGSDNPAMQMQMKIITYVMPIFLLFLLNNYASGLSWYYFVSNLLAVSQTLLFRNFVDDAKLEAKLHEAKQNRAKKSENGNKGGGLTGWLEKQQQKQKELLEQQKKSQAPTRKDRRK